MCKRQRSMEIKVLSLFYLGSKWLEPSHKSIRIQFLCNLLKETALTARLLNMQ